MRPRGRVLFGIATSGFVLSTLLHACDADSALITHLFPQRATVLTAAEFVELLKGRKREIVAPKRAVTFAFFATFVVML